MQMKKSFQNETEEIFNILSYYKTLMYHQIIRIFPGKNEITEKIIDRLISDKRIIYEEKSMMLTYGRAADKNPNMNLITAFWVLVDFLEDHYKNKNENKAGKKDNAENKFEKHYPSNYPVQITFFMDADVYEIIKVDYGKETVINHILSSKKEEHTNRIIIVDNEKQIPKIKVRNILCFCIVDKTGGIEYFNFE